jgi:hypothetical protein
VCRTAGGWSPSTTRRFWRKWFEWSVVAVCKLETRGHISCHDSLRGPLPFEAGCARSFSNCTNTLWSYKRLWICAAWCAIWQHTRLVCKQDILITTLKRPARLLHSRRLRCFLHGSLLSYLIATIGSVNADVRVQVLVRASILLLIYVYQGWKAHW